VAKPKRPKIKNEQQEKDWKLETILLSCRESASYQLFAQYAENRELTREEAREWIVRTWYEFLDDPTNVMEAIQFWRIWPKLLWIHRPTTSTPTQKSYYVEGVSRPGAKVYDGYERIVSIDCAHSKVQRIIICAAERLGLDGSIIEISGKHCQSIIHQRPEIGEFGKWPDCLNSVEFANKSDLEEAFDEIRQAERMLTKLEARLENEAKSQITVVENVDCNRPDECQKRSNSRLFSTGELAKKAGLSKRTMHKYAKMAHVNTPARGKRNHRYTWGDACSILQTIIDEDKGGKDIEKIKSALSELYSMEDNTSSQMARK